MTADPARLNGLPEEGDTIGGRYVVGELLGIGGMGVVRGARHITLGHELAIKLMLPEIAKNAGAAARFLREARAAVSIGSEHVARVIDVDELPNGTPYIVMERLRGQDLAVLLERRGPLPIEEAVDFVLQAAEAVAEAHTLGIVHRDIKPRNLFVAVRPDGELTIKVLDFGIAKATDAVSALTQTQGNVALGSPHYMSPEQVRDPGNVSARTDIWSIGVVLYQLTTGTVPFDEESLPALGAAIVGDPHPPLGERLSDPPAGFLAVVDRCLAKRAGDRFDDLADLARALEPYSSAAGKKSVSRCVRIFERRARETDATQPIRGERETGDMSAPLKAVRDPETQAGITASTRTEIDARRRLDASRLRLVLIGGGVVAVGLVIWFWFARPDAPAPVIDPPTPANAPLSATPSSSAAAPTPELAPTPVHEPMAPASSKTSNKPLAAQRIFHAKPPASPAVTATPTQAPPARDPYGDRK